jgi:hypothetical protein
VAAEDRLTIMRCIHDCVKKWGSSSVSNWGNAAAALRGATAGKHLF